MEPPVLDTPRLQLRLAEARDADEILDFFTRNREFFERTNPGRPDESYRREYWIEHVERMRQDFREGRTVHLFAFLHGSPSIVANANLSNIIRGNFQAATLGYCLDEAHTRRGLMSEVVSELVRYGFEVLRLHRIMANYWPENVASGRLLERHGFVREGYARDYLIIGGRWVDHYNTAKVNEAWRPPEPG
jgi:ribosomal-protein-alanine N-acetyltransferase